MKNKIMVLILILFLFISVISVSGASEISNDITNTVNTNLNIYTLNEVDVNSSLETTNYDSVTEYSPNSLLTNNNQTNTYINYTTDELDSTTYLGLNLYDENNQSLANQTVYFIINSVSYERTTNDLGYAQLRINLNPSVHEITLNYLGSETYEPSTNIFNLTVNRGYTSFIASDLVMYAGSGQSFDVKFVNALNQSLANRQVLIGVNGKEYTRMTDSNGCAYLNINLANGTYEMNYKFLGTNNLNSSSGTNSLTVLYNSTYFVSSDVIMNYSDRHPFSVKLYDYYNHSLANKTVSFLINGVYYNKTTDDEGQASLNIRLSAGTYKIDYFYSNKVAKVSSSGANLINITGTPTLLTVLSTNFKYGDQNYFKILVTDNNYNPLENITVKFTVNGITYNRITNSEGLTQLKINLHPGVYNMLYASLSHNQYEPYNGETNFIVNTTYLIGDNMRVYPYAGTPYTVTLLDLFNNPIAGGTIIFTINGVQYTRVTNNEGQASLNINLRVGDYGISYKCNGNDLPPSEGSSIIYVVRLLNDNYIWLNAANMNTVDLKMISNNNVGNILLNAYAFTKYGEGEVLNFINRAGYYGISVHIWMQCFYNGGWINPTTCGQGYINARFAEAAYYASLPGVAGVHLDYLRFPGTAYKYSGATNLINTFTQQITNIIHNINAEAIVSAAIMPEPSMNIHYYGQDSNILGKYLDVLMPMVYKGNYHQGDEWIKSVTSYFAGQVNKAKIVTGLQTYRSDSNIVPLPASELSRDVSYSYAGGADGVAFFRWGLVNMVPV